MRNSFLSVSSGHAHPDLLLNSTKSPFLKSVFPFLRICFNLISNVIHDCFLKSTSSIKTNSPTTAAKGNNKISVRIVLYRFQKILDHFSSVRSYFADSLENAHTIYGSWAPRARVKCVPSREMSSQISQVTFSIILPKSTDSWQIFSTSSSGLNDRSIQGVQSSVSIKADKKVCEYKIYSCHCEMARTPRETHSWLTCIPCEHLQWPSSQTPAKSALLGFGE